MKTPWQFFLDFKQTYIDRKLSDAVYEADIKRVSSLLKSGANPNAFYAHMDGKKSERTMLQMAVCLFDRTKSQKSKAKYNDQVITKLLQSGAAVKTLKPSILFDAVKYELYRTDDGLKAMELMIEMGAPTNEEGLPPLLETLQAKKRSSTQASKDNIEKLEKLLMNKSPS